VRTAIDTNIVSALWAGETTAGTVKKMLDEAAERGGLVICPVVYAELRAFPRATAAFVDKFLDDTGILPDWDIDRAVWQLAAERYEKYALRKRKQKMGEPKRLIADFLVGAHALLRADVLLTLDPRPYLRDFAELSVHP
jgi:predicted nucleic acid-binding protein